MTSSTFTQERAQPEVLLDLREVGGWLAEPGPALLRVKVEPMELVMPPFMELKPAVGMALYAARAILHGHAGELAEMGRENT